MPSSVFISSIMSLLVPFYNFSGAILVSYYVDTLWQIRQYTGVCAIYVLMGYVFYRRAIHCVYGQTVSCSAFGYAYICGLVCKLNPFVGVHFFIVADGNR